MPPAYAGTLVDHPTYPTPKKVLSRPTGNYISRDSPIRDEKVVPRVDPLPRVVNTIEEKGGSVQAPGRPMKDVATNKDKYFDRSHDGSHDAIDDLQVDHRPTSVMPVIHTIHERTTNDGAGDQSKKETGSSPGVTIDDEPGPDNDRIAGELDVYTYRHEYGELYAEDVDQHMAVLHDIVTPSAEVATNDIQVDDPDVPRTDDQERLRQLIWRNKHLLIGEWNAFPPAARGRYATLTWKERDRSHR